MQYFAIFQDKYSEPSKHTWTFSKTVQKISKNPYTASRFSLLTSAKFSVNIKRVTLQHNKKFIVFIFYLMVLKRCVISKAFDTRGILSTPASDVYERLKTKGKAMKIKLLRLPTINKEI